MPNMLEFRKRDDETMEENKERRLKVLESRGEKGKALVKKIRDRQKKMKKIVETEE